MARLKFSPSARQLILAAIRDAIKNDPTGQFEHVRCETLKVAEIIETATALGIDPAAYGTPKAGGRFPSAIPVLPVQHVDAAAPIAVQEAVAGPVEVADDAAEIEAVLALPFSQLEARIAELVKAANKPPVVQTVEVQTTGAASSIPTASPVRAVKALNALPDKAADELFGIEDFSNPVKIFDGGNREEFDKNYEWQPLVAKTLALLGGYEAKGKFIAWFWGPAGGGKTSAPRQFAAITGRPFFPLTFDGTMSRLEINGGFQAAADGSTYWKDGMLTAAIRQPGAVILLDEITRSSPDDIVFLNQVAESKGRSITIPETGEVVKVAPDVIFVICDNTNGTGDPDGRFQGTKVMDTSFLDRASFTVKVEPPEAVVEAKIVASNTGVTIAAARQVVTMGRLLRKATREGQASNLTPSIRGLTDFVVAVLNGFTAREAFEVSLVGNVTPDDYEVGQGLFSEHVETAKLEAAIRREEWEEAQPENVEGADGEERFAPREDNDKLPF